MERAAGEPSRSGNSACFLILDQACFGAAANARALPEAASGRSCLRAIQLLLRVFEVSIPFVSFVGQEPVSFVPFVL